jgi:hypothetical protein
MLCYNSIGKKYRDNNLSFLSLGILKRASRFRGVFLVCQTLNTMKNARYANGALRRKYRGRFKSLQLPCGICHGRLGPIRYDEPSDSKHPLSFVIDEIRPISRYKEFGYNSPREAAESWENLQPAHYCCNAWKSNKVNFSLDKHFGAEKQAKKINILDGEW